MEELDEILNNYKCELKNSTDTSKIHNDFHIIYYWILNKYLNCELNNKTISNIGKDIHHYLSLYNDEYLYGCLNMNKIKVVSSTRKNDGCVITKDFYHHIHGVVVDGMYYYWYQFIKYLEEKYYYVSVLNKIDRINENNC